MVVLLQKDMGAPWLKYNLKKKQNKEYNITYLLC